MSGASMHYMAWLHATKVNQSDSTRLMTNNGYCSNLLMCWIEKMMSVIVMYRILFEAQ